MPKALIIDSSKFSASFIGKALQLSGFNFDIADSYEKAEELLNKHTYFVGLSSIVIEGVASGKGIDLLLEHKIPAIAVTSSLDESVLTEISKKNIVDYVLKKSEHAKYIEKIVRRVYRNKKIKVMVVDDSRSVRSWLSNILQRQGLTVLTAANGREAGRLFNSNPDIKLVLTDYTMPEMDGLELTAHLRTIMPMDELSIIVLSSDSKSRTAPLFLKTGANDFIHKSASIEEVLCRVNSNLDALEMIQESRDIANRDFLTGIWTRRYFFENAEQIYSRYTQNNLPLSLAIMDIDHFKKVNDSFGHDAGDAVLKQFATLLTEYVGEKGLAARLGGEEFTIILDDVESGATYHFLDTFREKVKRSPVIHKGQKITYTVSIGCTEHRGSSLSDMISRADTMLYKAKTEGRDKVYCDV
ncbi:diguanylate cyclase [Maridesulfovibrio sp.]|uniref:GGDEF domain-containing response regulator n=1 Tax=Maridesulfovibrio sp. TaxID=2795000 RepID=UPI002A186CBC|nr:diguanylate cyclase [Maridesulfovibrio sp.]